MREITINRKAGPTADLRLSRYGFDKSFNWYNVRQLVSNELININDKLFSSELVRDLASGFTLLAELYHSLYKLKTR